MKDRIRNLLISGLKPSEIASIVGCTPSYVSQLLADAEFKASVQEGIIAAQAEKTEEDHIDNRYQNLEHKILSSVEESLSEASLMEKVRALEMINKRQDSRHARKNPAPTGPIVNVNVVSLALPQQALLHRAPIVQMNGNKEIVAIDNQPLAPLSSDGVKNLFAQITASKQEAAAVLAEI